MCFGKCVGWVEVRNPTNITEFEAIYQLQEEVIQPYKRNKYEN